MPRPCTSSGGQQLSRITVDVQDVPAILGSLSFDDDRFDIQLAQGIPGGTAGIGFLDATGQRAFTAHG